MFGNHLKVALRNFTKYPGHTAINLFGLTVGLTVCLLVAAYVAHELSFEDCHAKKDRIYRVQLNLETDEMGTMVLAGAAPPLGPALREGSPDVEAIARFRRFAGVKIAAGTAIRKNQTVLAVEPEFFSVFDVAVLRGNPVADLAEPNTIYLTESLANSLFGAEDPIGKTVTVASEIELHVAGILKDFPSNTQLRAEALASYNTPAAMGTAATDWMSIWTDYLYLLLRPGGDIASVEALMPPLVQRHVDEEYRSRLRYETIPLGDVYFSPCPGNELSPQGDMDSLLLFIAVALVTLAVACVNFVNHTTARASNRTKELTVRKIIGAGRAELVRQLLVESMLVAALAAVAAAALFEICEPVLGSFVGRVLDVGLLKQPLMVLVVVGLPLVVGLLAGLYPSIYLSRTRPLQFLKGGGGPVWRKSRTRRVLVVFQFATAIILTSVSAVVISQVHFSRTWDKGFNERGVIVLEFDDAQSAAAIPRLKDQLANDPGVVAVSACDMLPGTQNARLSRYQPSDRVLDSPPLIRGFSVDPDFTAVLGLTLTEGRPLLAEDAASNGRNILIDQQAATALGLEEPVGARISTEDQEYNIVGVLKDFHSVTTLNEDWPLMMVVNPDRLRHLLVRLEPETAAATIERIRTVWERTVQTLPFEYQYYDQILARWYGDHRKLGTLMSIFSVIALIIAGLGVFSLASYAAERRRREIGIRKVVGATVSSVMKLLCSEFVVLVLVAGVVGCPIAWYLSNRWLERFVYRIDVGVGLLLLAGATCLAVALLSVSFQALRAARTNPADVLRYE